MQRWLKSACPGEPIQMVYYTWPGDGYVPVLLPVEIAILGRRSSLHGLYLAELIRQLPAETRISLIGHSGIARQENGYHRSRGFDEQRRNRRFRPIKFQGQLIVPSKTV